MIIRWAEPEDLERIVEIFNYEVLNGTSSFSIYPKTMEERREWFEEHNRDTHPLIVAEKEGKVIGYASLSSYRSNDAYDSSVELSIYVDRDYRGQRVGKSLMEHLLKLARENGGIHAVLSVITGDNEVSMRLHEKFGFECCGVTREVGKKFGRYLDTAIYELIL